jgi:hypothetical protein
MEERDFFCEICLTALYTSKDVRFSAVVDDTGKLIVAENKKGFQKTTKPNSMTDDCQTSYLFYLDYLLPAIRERRFYLEDYVEKIYFELKEINNDVKIAVAPLTQSKDKYLCVYIESSASYQEIIMKLNSNI